MSEHFEEHRRLLFGTAYRMLGSVSDAEDNGEPGLLLVHHGATVGAMTFETADGRITAMRVSVNPRKLRGLRL
ncbi:hypothetical protein ABTX85_06505 [Streptomyces sp. NPDC096097]|uniref:hypothetical protein n=1 Tax=Streptomyces sp. NPDC096097 TaxID=3155546 RepID=UPI00332D4183